VVTTLPFTVRDHTMSIVKHVPVRQWSGCRDYLLDDAVMAQVDQILDRVDVAAE